MTTVYAELMAAVDAEQLACLLQTHDAILYEKLQRHAERPMRGVPTPLLAYAVWIAKSDAHIAYKVIQLGLDSGVILEHGFKLLSREALLALRSDIRLYRIIEVALGALPTPHPDEPAAPSNCHSPQSSAIVPPPPTMARVQPPRQCVTALPYDSPRVKDKIFTQKKRNAEAAPQDERRILLLVSENGQTSYKIIDFPLDAKGSSAEWMDIIRQEQWTLERALGLAFFRASDDDDGGCWYIIKLSGPERLRARPANPNKLLLSRVNKFTPYFMCLLHMASVWKFGKSGAQVTLRIDISNLRKVQDAPQSHGRYYASEKRAAKRARTTSEEQDVSSAGADSSSDSE